MSIGLGVTQVERAVGVDLNSADDVFVFAVVKPVNVQRIGFINSSDTASGTTVTVAVDHRPVAGSDSDRVELFSVTPEESFGQGEGVYKDATDRYEINPGEELVLEVTEAGGAGLEGTVFLEYVPYPFVGERVDENMTEVE